MGSLTHRLFSILGSKPNNSFINLYLSRKTVSLKIARRFYANSSVNTSEGKCGPILENHLPLPNYSYELNCLAQQSIQFNECHRLERQFIKSFDRIDKSRQHFFNYILLDPNVTQNIAFNTKFGRQLTFESHLFIKFIKSIFYVGKGHGNRVYQHFYESNKLIDKRKSAKNQRILSIWSTNKGVISLSCFNGITSGEALAREAMIIDAMCLKNLTNQINGHKRDQLKWCEAKRRLFGAFLLYKAFGIYLLNNERQIRRPVL